MRAENQLEASSQLPSFQTVGQVPFQVSFLIQKRLLQRKKSIFSSKNAFFVAGSWILDPKREFLDRKFGFRNQNPDFGVSETVFKFQNGILGPTNLILNPKTDFLDRKNGFGIPKRNFRTEKLGFGTKFGILGAQKPFSIPKRVSGAGEPGSESQNGFFGPKNGIRDPEPTLFAR
jgi:hypothetical protein